MIGERQEVPPPFISKEYARSVNSAKIEGFFQVSKWSFMGLIHATVLLGHLSVTLLIDLRQSRKLY